MKMVKKVLMGLAVAAIALALTGCGNLLGNKIANGLNDDDDDVVVEGEVKGSMITGQASNAKIEVNNTENKIKREVDLLLTKHYGSRAKIVQENIDTTKANGMMGYAFNVVEHKEAYTEDGEKKSTYDLCIVGTTYYKGKPVTYVSAFRNIKKLNDQNLGATDAHVYNAKNDANAAKFKNDTEPCEYEIIALPVENEVATKNLDYYAYDAAAKTFTVCINVTAENDGSYTIDWYNPADVLKDSGSWISATRLKDVTDKKTVTIPASVTGYSAKAQAYLGVYANVYGLKALKGSWRLSGIKGEAEVEEFED